MRKRMKYLEVTALVVAVLLFGYAAVTSTPASLGQSAKDSLATVGVSLAVTQNPYNSAAEQLAQKQKLLDQREADLASREHSSYDPSGRLALYSLATSLALFVLVALNFYFDVKRRGPTKRSGQFSVDLR